MKKCFRCGQDKDLCEFSKNIKSSDGLYSYCKECRKQYRKDNLDRIKIYDNTYSKTSKFKESQKKYKSNNKDKINTYRRKYRLEVSLNDELFILKTSIRDAIRHSIKNKGYSKKSPSHEILGCSFEEFKQHIESLWEPWMNWDNYGNPKDCIFEPNKTWDLDHITPSSSAKTEDDVLRLNHYTNLRPLCSYYNRWIKKDFIFS
jgi:hypothetical protein